MRKFSKLLCFMVVFVTVMGAFCTVSFAATVGDRLLIAEDGWQRIDDKTLNTKSISTGTWIVDDGNGSYIYHGSQTLTNTISATKKFKFYGSKIRLISYPYSNRSSDSKIVIDGVSYNVNMKTLNSSPITIVFEKLDLEYGYHTVTFLGGTTGYTFCYDAIDIDSLGSLVDYYQPTNLSASAGNSKVELSWTAVEGAASYNIKRATIAGGPYTTIATSSATTYIDTTVKTGTTYYYVVTAIINGIESDNSNVATVTLQIPVPLVPTNLSTTPENSKVKLSWTESEGTTFYNIKRATTSGGPYTTITTSSAITYTDTLVKNGIAYYYVVSAKNVGGESLNSNEATATPINPAVTLEVISVYKAKLGDEITANVVIHNATNICAEDIKLAFDTTRLDFISAEGVDGIKIYKEELSEGIRRYITASLGKTNAANGDKVLLKLKFKAKAIGEAKIDITNGRIADNATLEMDVDQANCGEKTILIEGIKDVNRTGEYTLLDLGIDAWYYGDAVATTDTTKYDADQVVNGTIDDGDLTEIVTQILNNKNYPALTNG